MQYQQLAVEECLCTCDKESFMCFLFVRFLKKINQLENLMKIIS